MFKTLPLLALLTLPTLGFAQDFACTTQTLTGADEPEEVKVVLKGDQVELSGFGSMPVLEKVTAPMDGQALAACGSIKDSYECIKALVPGAELKNNSLHSLYNNLSMIDTLRSPSYIEEEGIEGIEYINLPSTADFDISKVASGTIHVMQFGGYYPNIGIYEYHDEKGVLMGRFFHNLLSSSCK